MKDNEIKCKNISFLAVYYIGNYIKKTHETRAVQRLHSRFFSSEL